MQYRFNFMRLVPTVCFGGREFDEVVGSLEGGIFMPQYQLGSRYLARLLAVLLAPAILTLISARSAYADDVKAHFDKGVALVKEHQMDGALDEFNQVRKELPDDPATLSYIGLIQLSRQKYSDALEVLERAVALKPDMADAHLNLGNVYDRLKRYSEALREFKIATQLRPKSSDAYYDLGAVYYEMKRLPEAVTAYQKAAALAPNDPVVQNNLGFTLEAAGKIEAAAVAYQHATRLAPTNALYWQNLGIALQTRARDEQNAAGRSTPPATWNEARQAFARAAELAPNDYGIRENYAVTLYDMGRSDEALTQFEKATQLKPAEFAPHYFQGLILLKFGRTQPALEAASLAVKAAPNNRDALRLQGILQSKQGQYGEAATTFTLLTKVAPDELRAWANLAVALDQAGDEAAATAALEEALKRGATGKQVAPLRRTVGNYLFRKGDADSLKRAVEEYTQSLKDAPDSAEGYNGLGLALQKQGQIDPAIDALKHAVALSPKYADAYNNLGVVYQIKGDLAQATASYRKALEADPNNANAKQNLARLPQK
jgi:superkiller protein 3